MQDDLKERLQLIAELSGKLTSSEVASIAEQAADRIEALEAERDRYKALVKEAGEGLAFYADDDRYEYDQTCCFDTRGISRKRVAEIHETGGDILFDRGDRAATTLAKIKEATDA